MAIETGLPCSIWAMVKKIFPDYFYIPVEDPVIRSAYLNLTAQQWAKVYPNALLDEVQKETGYQ